MPFFTPASNNPPIAIWLVRDDHTGHDGEVFPATGVYDPIEGQWNCVIEWRHLPKDMQARAPVTWGIEECEYVNALVPESQVTFSPIAMLQQGQANVKEGQAPQEVGTQAEQAPAHVEEKRKARKVVSGRVVPSPDLDS